MIYSFFSGRFIMSKFNVSLIALALLLLTAGPAAADAPGHCPESPFTLSLDAGGLDVTPAAFDARDPRFSFLLTDQYECLNRCQAEYDSCVSGAGDDASKRFMCGENRFACTRSCDNANYSVMEF